jgi:hypothetical protein
MQSMNPMDSEVVSPILTPKEFFPKQAVAGITFSYQSKTIKTVAFFTLIFNILVSICFAQDKKDERITRFQNHISLAAHLTNINLTSTIRNVDKADKIEFRTATATRLGISFDYRWLGFEVFTRLPFSQAAEKGKTRNRGIFVRINKPRFWVNAVWQRFSGMYWSNPDAAARTILQPGYFPIRDDIFCNLLHLNAFYIFSPNRFSNPAAQGENERQLKSGGSFLLGLGFFFDVMHGDQPFIPQSQATNFENLAQVNEIKARFLSLSGGYAHTFVLFKKAYFSIYMIPGLSRFNASQTTLSDEKRTAKGQWAPRLDLRLSMGYNTDKYFGGIMAQSIVNNQDLGQGTTFSNGFATLRLFFGRRFQMKRNLGMLNL